MVAADGDHESEANQEGPRKDLSHQAIKNVHAMAREVLMQFAELLSNLSTKKLRLLTLVFYVPEEWGGILHHPFP